MSAVFAAKGVEFYVHRLCTEESTHKRTKGVHNSVDNVDNLQKVDNYRALKRGERCLKLF